MENKEKVIKWFKCVGVRAIKTLAPTTVTTIGTNIVMKKNKKKSI